MTYQATEESRYSGSLMELYRFTQGGNVWAFTPADHPPVGFVDPLDAGEYSYLPIAMSRTPMKVTREDTSENITVTVPIDNPVAALFIPFTPATPVGLVIFRMHRLDPDHEAIPHFIGSVVSIATKDSTAQLLCAPVSQTLKRKVPRLSYQKKCNWFLGSPGCGIDLASFTDSATLSAVTGLTIVSSTFAAKPDGYYKAGFVTSAAGDRRFVVEHVGNTITLEVRFPATITAGAVVSATAGCDGTEAVCKDKFDNLVNHLGFSRIPGKNPYAGNSIV